MNDLRLEHVNFHGASTVSFHRLGRLHGRRERRRALADGHRPRPERGAARAVVLVLVAALAATGLVAGPATPSGAIVNGASAPEGAYPWMTYIRQTQLDGSWSFCGGTLVAPTWVLTARHCFLDGTLTTGTVEVWVAGNQIATTGGFHARAVEMRVHPKAGNTFNTSRFDVALLRLDRVVPVAPVRLATTQQASLVEKGRPARVLGWGNTQEGTPDDPATTTVNEYVAPNTPSMQLRQADVVIGDPALGPRYDSRFDPELDILERPGAGDQHSCQGDSGGPMLVDVGGGDWRQVANLSWGNCQRDDYVMIWNRLINGPFREWLDGQINGMYGYVHVPDPLNPSSALAANATSSSPTLTNSVFRSGTGSYDIVFSGLASGGGVAHVAPAGASPGRCWLAGWEPSLPNERVGVRCSTLGGAPADLPFTVSYGLPLALSVRADAEFAQLWADRPTTASYEPARSHVMTSNGARPRITRLSAGRYQVVLPGLWRPGVAKVSTVGGSRDCVAERVTPQVDGQTIVVQCSVPTADGFVVGVDSGFALTYLNATGLGNTDRGDWAYLLADRPSDASFIPTRQKSSTGATTVVARLDLGRYRVTLPGLAADHGSVQVSSATPWVQCAGSAQAFGRDEQVDVRCWRKIRSALLTVTDAPRDAAFTVVFDSAPRPPKAFADFDGDGRKDQVVFRPVNGTWYGINSADGTRWSRQFGQVGDIPVPADYDGDGRTDIAVARRAPYALEWHWINSRTGTGGFDNTMFRDDIPVPGDYDGDGRAERATWSPASAIWRYVSTLNARHSGKLQFGSVNDTPVAGDWDGDGRTDLAVFRPSAGKWFTTSSRNGTEDLAGVSWGYASDKLVPSDYDGDGTVDHAVFRPVTGTWFVRHPDITRQFGLATDIPVAGDYDGDGKADVAVWRPANGTWYRFNSGTNTHAQAVQWGLAGDIPIV